MADKSKSPVRQFFQSCRTNRVRTGRGIATGDLKQVAAGVNYLVGRGNQLIPAFHMDVPSGSSMPHLAGITPYTTLLRVAPGFQAIDRYWTLGFTAAGQGIAELSVSGSQLNPVETIPINVVETFHLYREPVNSVSPDVSGTQEIRIQFTLSSSGGAGIIPSTWSCFEAPRRFMNPLSQSSEGGVDESSFNIQQPIYDSGRNQYASLAGIARNIKLAQNQVRRAGLFTWATPLDQLGNEFDEFALITTSSTFEQKLLIPIIARPTFRNTPSASVTLMWVSRNSDATFGSEILFETPTTQFQYVLTGSAATALETWQSGTISVPVTDVNNPRGLPTSSLGGSGYVQYITMSMRITNQNAAISASQQFKVWTVQIFEPHQDLILFSGSYTA